MTPKLALKKKDGYKNGKRKSGSEQTRNKEIQMKKNWYCVHAIFYFELMQWAQDSYLVYENVYLIRAVNSELAQKKYLEN